MEARPRQVSPFGGLGYQTRIEMVQLHDCAVFSSRTLVTQVTIVSQLRPGAASCLTWLRSPHSDKL